MSETRKMRSTVFRLATLLLLAVLFMGCGRGGDPVAPNAPQPGFTGSGGQSVNGRVSWGLWSITIDPVAMTAEVVPLRSGDIHYNVLHMLEGWACTDCVGVQSIDWADKQTMLAEVVIRHPYPLDRLDLTGRDVRGIVIFDGTTSFPITTTRDPDDKDMPILASRRLLNPDGYTTHFNRWTANEGTKLNEYRKGRFAPPGESGIVGNLHPFKVFYTHNYKQLFYPGFSVSQTYELAVEKFQPFTFAYSIDASWSLPLHWPVYNPITDFSISANSREAFQISMTVENNTLTRQGGQADLTFDIFDHQGYETISTFTIEAPDLFDGLQTVDPASAVLVEEEMARYLVTVQNKTGEAKVEGGGSDILVVIEDVDESIVGEDVKAYNIFTLPVEDVPKDWRPRDGAFLSLSFPGPAPDSNNLDLTVIPDPKQPWAFEEGVPMLVFNDDDQQRYLACNREFDEWTTLAGYPANPTSWIRPTRRLDAASRGAFGVISDSDTAVSGDYLVRHCTNMHLNGGLYNYSWYVGSLDDPTPHLERAGDVSGGFGLAPNDPVYSIYLYEFDPIISPVAPPYQSIHRIESPYNIPGAVIRAFVPLMNSLSGNSPPYGVSQSLFVAMDVDDDPVGVGNPLTVQMYAAENQLSAPGTNARELDVYEIPFTDPNSPVHIQTYHSAILGNSAASAIAEDPRIVDAAVLPAATNNVGMGLDQYPEHNWFAVLYAFDLWQRWYIEIFDAHLPSASDPSWDKPLYTIGPYSGNALAMDVDPVYFEIYVLDDDPMIAGNLRLSCLEYY